jgi:hypothetical protein
MIGSAATATRHAWLVVLVVLLAVFLQEQVLAPLLNYSDQERRAYHANDLKHLYLGGRLLLRGENPYPAESLHLEAARVRHPEMRTLNPYVYPPFAGYFFGWLGEMDYEKAKLLWYWGSQACLLASILLFAYPPSGVPLTGWLAVLAASVAFFAPLGRSVTAGQLNHFLLLLLSLVFFFWRRGGKKAAAALIGLAAMIKVVPGFFVLWLGWKREWGAFATALVVMILLVLIPGVRFGLNPYFDYVSVLADMGFGRSTWSDQGAAFYVDKGNIGLPALLYRTLAPNPRTEPWVDLGSTAYVLCLLWALGVLAVCLLCCRVRRRDEDPEMELGAWLFGMLLIPSLFWDHYLVLALPAWWTLAARLSRSGLDDFALALVAFSWVWAGWRFYYWADGAYLSGVGVLCQNAPLPAVLFLFALCAWMARNGEWRIGSRE